MILETSKSIYNIRMKYYFGKWMQDGKLDENSGRIIIHDGNILVSYLQTVDHNYLLRAFAARYRYDKDEVISGACRLYFQWVEEKSAFIVSPVRDEDRRLFEANFEENRKLVKRNLK